MAVNGILLGSNINDNAVSIKESFDFSSVGEVWMETSYNFISGDAGNKILLGLNEADDFYRVNLSDSSFLSTDKRESLVKPADNCYGIYFLKPNIWIYCSQGSVGSDLIFSFYYSTDKGSTWTYKELSDIFTVKGDLVYGQDYNHTSLIFGIVSTSYRATKEYFYLDNSFTVHSIISSSISYGDGNYRYTFFTYDSPYYRTINNNTKTIYNLSGQSYFTGEKYGWRKSDSFYIYYDLSNQKAVDGYIQGYRVYISGPYSFYCSDNTSYLGSSTCFEGAEISSNSSIQLTQNLSNGIFYEDTSLPYGNIICLFPDGLLTYNKKNFYYDLYKGDTFIVRFTK